MDTTRLEEILLKIHLGLSTTPDECYNDGGGIHRIAVALERIATCMEKEQAIRANKKYIAIRK